MLKIERREAGRNPRPGMSASRKRIMMPTRPRRIAGAALAVSLLAAVPARAASESVLYQFQNGRDGAYSFTGLTELDGTLYGGTWGGGNAHGTVFALTKDGKQKVLHAFDIGAGPYVGNLINVDGTFYGTTYYGGTGGCISDYADGCGTIFTVTPTGSYKTLFNFHGSSDGEGAVGLLKVGNEFFGTTALGGAANAGTIFKVSTTGHLKTLYTFKGGSDGANPFGTLINVGGTLYGTTEWGGSATMAQYSR
ncbi:MAG: choice-of-anchor tandem repeat GloVer-containing protein [Rhodospirillales bacterium]